MFNAFQLRQFADILEATARGLREVADGKPAAPQPEGTPLRECNLSERAKKTCIKMGVRTVEELASKTEGHVTRIRNSGVRVLNELRAALAKHDKKFTEPMV